MNRVPLGAFAACCAAALVAQQPVAVEASIKTADPTNRSAPIPAIAETVTLSKQAPDGVPAWKDCEEPWYGVKSFGGKKVTIIVGKSKADLEQPDTLCVDLNADGKIDKSECMTIEVSAQTRGTTSSSRSKTLDLEFAPAGARIPAKITFQRAGENAPVASLQFPSYLEAKVRIGDQERVVAVADKDFDGRFDSAQDVWMLAKPDRDPKERAPNSYELSLLNERRFDNGMLVGIKVDKSNVIQVTTTKAAGLDARDASAQRERAERAWKEHFAKERETFISQRKIDLSRPHADQPVLWNYVTFDTALALAKKRGKPVFIDVMAFWCVWCYCMDYYTYPDREVTELLNNSFLPVKIIQEQDAVGDYDKVMKGKLEATGIPAMGIFDGSGKLLHKIDGWKKPEDFVTELKAGLEAHSK